jgi:3-hydroxymyristoyl/3-hydroxydecanoyl-(acyl carrier protein) dehydratase
MARVEARLAIARDHPAYAGHFPGRPMLPGVVLLAEALAAIETATGRAAKDWRVESAKFVATVTPGTQLRLVHEAQSSGRVHFEIHSPHELVARGVLAPLGADSP